LANTAQLKGKLKEKIESLGKPLKNWDVKIYYGIKTGLNDAFIITTEKRDEIFNLLYETIKEGRRQKVFREDIHPRILTFLIMGMMNWFYQWYRPDGPRSIEKIIEDVQNFLFEGVLSHRS
jgi:hypothetical protein